MEKVEKQGSSRIAGWLLVLVIQLVIGSLASVWSMHAEVITSETQYPALLTIDKWSTYKTIIWCLCAMFLALRCYCVWDLHNGKTWATVQRTIVILWITAPIWVLLLSVLVPTIIFGNSWTIDERVPKWVIGCTFTATIWTAYLLKSIRVRNTYGEPETQQNIKSVPGKPKNSAETLTKPTNLRSSQKTERQPAIDKPSPEKVGSPNEPSKASNLTENINFDTQDISNVEQRISVLENSKISVACPLNISSDRIYEKALKEIEDNKPHKASWARAFSETEGDEIKTKALYIKLRVANIENKLRQEEEKRQQKEAQEKEVREQELRRLQAIKEAEEKKIALAKEKAKLIDSLEERWSNLIRKHESKLAEYQLDDYLYDIAIVSSDERKHYASWVMDRDKNWVSDLIAEGPKKHRLGNYGVTLIVALERKINIQAAKKWGRPSRFAELDNQ